MPARRVEKIRHPVTLRLDGEEVRAERGEPLAVSLVAHGAFGLARSPKFHRPRGPACLRAACDGCLLRVNGLPNQMACRTEAREGVEATTQNTLGSRKVDLLRMTDWFFPEGMNHHELFAGVPGVQSVMQAFARRVAGLGKLPREARPPTPAKRVEEDVCVVGAGPSGMASALAFTKRGRKVRVVDDGLVAGGVALAYGGDAGPFGELLRAFRGAVEAKRIVLSLETTAGAFFERDLLVVGDGAEIVRAATTVLAVGAHDGQAAFEGNDLPAVVSARAAAIFLAHGVLVGEKCAIVRPDGGTSLGARFVDDVRARGGDPIVLDELPEEVLGTSEVTGASVLANGERVIYDVDAIVLDLPPCPSHELAVQAGASVRHELRGYVVCAGPDGRIADGVVAVGEMVGTPLVPEAILAEAERVAGT